MINVETNAEIRVRVENALRRRNLWDVFKQEGIMEEVISDITKIQGGRSPLLWSQLEDFLIGWRG
jgi:hypothetical protein